MRTALLIAVFLVVWAALNLGDFQALNQARVERDREQAAVTQLESELRDMEIQREALNSDLQAVERAAREQHKMTFSGEVVVHIDRSTLED